MSKEKPAHILRFFAYSDLPREYQDVCVAVYALADEMDSVLVECAEKSAGLRKLLEARDCFVRAIKEGSE